MRRVVPFLFVLLVLDGCAAARFQEAAETPEQRYWAALNTFKEYNQAGLNLAENPNTPPTVRRALKNARNVAKGLLVLADEAYAQLQLVRTELEVLPDPTNQDRLIAALAVFNSRADRAFDKIDAFANLIDRVR